MTTHIVKSYEEQLQNLNNAIVQMGGLAETQLENAVNALIDRDSDAADTTIGRDDRIDDLEKILKKK